MILSGQSIRERIRIDPFMERTKFHGMSYGLGPAGYDVRAAQAVDLDPGAFGIFSILEHITMPNNVLGFVHDKSTLARLGLALQNTVVEPGWRGHLTLEISNHGCERVRLPTGSPIAQLIFHQTDRPCVPYDGKYQDQGRDPVFAIFEGDEP